MSEGQPSRGEAAAWMVAVAATLGMSVSYIDRQTLAAIAPAVRASLHLDHRQYGWLVSAFSMAYLVGAPAAGIMVDRLGARRGFAAAVVVWSVIAGAHALATTFAALFALRILLGAAEAPSFPAAAQSIRRALPDKRRPAAFGLLFTGSSIGSMIAAPLALHLEARYGFRFAFLGTAVIGTAWLPLWLLATRNTPVAEKPAPSPVVVTTEERGSWLALVTSPPVLRAMVCIFGSAPGIMFVLTFASQYLVEVWKLPRTEIGGHLVVGPLLFDIGAVAFGYVASRRTNEAHRTHKDLMLLSMTLSSLLALAPLAPSSWIAVALFGLAASGGGGIYVLVTNDMLTRVPVHRTSAAGGMTAAAQSLSHIVAGPLVGWVIDRTHDGNSYGAALVGLGVLVIPTTLAFVLWPGLDER